MTDRNAKPFAPACERNRDPILGVLREQFADRKRVLEIGSGTGQHAVQFAAALSHLNWQTSDRAEHLPGIELWLAEANLANTSPPLLLDVNQGVWPAARFDAVFSANTLHIMAWAEIETMFARLSEVISEDAKLAIYGPFNIDGQFTSASNAAFDDSLRQRGAHMGIRDLADIDALAAKASLRRIADYSLPANNRCVIWQRGN